MKLPPITGFLKGSEYLKITILSAGLAALSQSIHGIILPLRVLDFVGEDDKNTALAAITFTGLILAMLFQPIAAAISDSTTSRWGRRKPFVIFGGLALLLLLPGVALVSSFAVLFTIYCLIQLAGNTAQGPYQGYIPDLVPLDHRGRASSLKSEMELFGGAAGVMGAGILMSHYSGGDRSGLWVFLLCLEIFIGGILFYLGRNLKESPVRKPLKRFNNPLSAYRFNLNKSPAFGWLLGSRLLFFMAAATLQQFALFYLRDVLGVSDPAGFTAIFILTAGASMALAILPAGFFTDRYGAPVLSRAAGLLGGFGVLLLLLWPSTVTLIITAGVTGFAIGIFGVSNWAMATKMVVKGEEAKYLAIANMATAGGAAIARLIGPVIDYFNRMEANLGYQVMLAACLFYFLLAGLLVKKPKRQPRQFVIEQDI
ncbi:MFS/sugar transport protein [Dehalogenimonas formicexedens]|uniref:MFS/sugar transport protein n=1 Tax=Dehalogenimonas formicexedens TaxID=1839801 RepID=A0A1P8F954_9CHLR|nr:MFS transporter [Dehalogenimonas formicexedens]APV44999.1 MFS/sugar transport protein [Dehalogenimonas formicexedens]